MRSPALSSAKNTAEIAAMPDGKATARRVLEMAEHVFDCVPGRIVEAAILVEAGGIARQMKDRRHGQRQRDGVALGEIRRRADGRGAAARDCGVSVIGDLNLIRMVNEVAAGRYAGATPPASAESAAKGS